MKRNIVIGIIIAILVIAGLVYAFNRPKTNTQESRANNNPPNAQAQVRTVQVTGREYMFDPAVITVNRGEKIRIVFTNAGSFSHNWVVDGFNAKTATVPAGQAAEVTFTAERSGIYEYYCSVENHKDLGMRGQLIVQ